jgi:hypothetical protein
VQSAQSNLFFNVLVMTRTDVADAIAAEGVNTAGMVNDTGSQYSGTCFQTIKAAIGNHMMLYNGSYLLHHKYLVADVNTSNDPLIWTGSHNWSNSADQRNDENVVVVHDQAIANQYFQEFSQRFHDNGGIISVAENNPVITSFMVYPNPANENVNVSFEMKKPADVEISISDICGRTLSGKKIFAKQGINAETIDISRFSKGIYLLKMQADKYSCTTKIVVE